MPLWRSESGLGLEEGDLSAGIQVGQSREHGAHEDAPTKDVAAGG